MRKKFLAALLAVCMVASLLVAPTSAATFDDVDDSHWAAGAIERWADYGVLNGHGDGTFGPEGDMTRAQFASMVVNLLGLTNKSGITFPDVEADSSLAWAKDVIDIAATNGIITGYSDGSFGGQRSVTFTAGATMLSRALGLVSVEESSGTGYATAAVEKLTELDMLDENVNGEMTFDRAGVAGLADNMIAYYATEDKPLEEAITGEVKGVILAVGTEVVIEDATIAAPVLVNEGASVEIKNSTVSAPIVVTSAEVTLTGTTAEDVKVSGDNAAVTADKDSSVADVTVEGTAPAIELNGEVKGNVTVAEGTTGVEIKGDGVSADNVVNNTTEDITVNGEAVEGKPVEETPEEPDDNNTDVIPSVPSNPGSSSGSNGEDIVTPPDAPEVPVVPDVDTTTKDPDKTTESNLGSEHTCTFSTTADSTTPATCQAQGTSVYKCTTDGCEATKTVYTPKVAHAKAAENPVVKETVAATCANNGYTAYKCQWCDAVADVVTLSDKPNHNYSTGWVQGDTTHWHQCTVCGAKDSEANHAADNLTSNGESGHTGVCVCGKSITEEHNLVEVAGSATDSTCTVKGHEADKKCECGYTVKGAEKELADHTWGEADEDGKVTCKVCGAVKPTETTPPESGGSEGDKDDDKT